MQAIIELKLELLLDTGYFFSVTFIKRTTGKLRRLTTRGHIHKERDGNGKNYRDEDYGLITLYDIHKRDWRSVPKENIIAINNVNLKELTV